MKVTKYHFIISILIIAVISIAAFLGIWLGNGAKWYRTIAEGIIIRDDNKEHESEVLTAYTEYTDLLSDLGISRDVFLTAGNFDDYDYIVDYIYYDEDLKIEEISLQITEEGTVIEYEVNKEVTDSDEILIYFIRIDKGQISDYQFARREFKVN